MSSSLAISYPEPRRENILEGKLILIMHDRSIHRAQKWGAVHYISNVPHCKSPPSSSRRRRSSPTSDALPQVRARLCIALGSSGGIWTQESRRSSRSFILPNLLARRTGSPAPHSFCRRRVAGSGSTDVRHGPRLHRRSPSVCALALLCSDIRQNMDLLSMSMSDSVSPPESISSFNS